MSINDVMDALDVMGAWDSWVARELEKARKKK